VEDPQLLAVAAALRAHRRAEAREERTLAELHAAIVAALKSGSRGRQAELVKLTGYTRERLRQLANAAAERRDPRD
jgi:hypothetical protein